MTAFTDHVRKTPLISDQVHSSHNTAFVWRKAKLRSTLSTFRSLINLVHCVRVSAAARNKASAVIWARLALERTGAKPTLAF